MGQVTIGWISFLSAIISSVSFDINMTTLDFVIAQVTYIFLGLPSSLYKKEAFINSLLYGHSDVNFSY